MLLLLQHADITVGWVREATVLLANTPQFVLQSSWSGWGSDSNPWTISSLKWIGPLTRVRRPINRAETGGDPQCRSTRPVEEGSMMPHSVKLSISWSWLSSVHGRKTDPTMTFTSIPAKNTRNEAQISSYIFALLFELLRQQNKRETQTLNNLAEQTNKIDKTVRWRST